MKKLSIFVLSALWLSVLTNLPANAETKSYSLSSPRLIESTLIPGGVLDFRFRLATNNSTSEPVYCAIDGFINPFEARLVSGTFNEGEYSCREVIPDKPLELFPSGRYPFDVLVIYFNEFGKQDFRQTLGYVTYPLTTPTTTTPTTTTPTTTTPTTTTPTTTTATPSPTPTTATPSPTPTTATPSPTPTTAKTTTPTAKKTTSAVAKPKASVKPKLKTITCVKGKVTKKVTSAKPKCPAGYKKK
jgi:hypothetical protein